MAACSSLPEGGITDYGEEVAAFKERLQKNQQRIQKNLTDLCREKQDVMASWISHIEKSTRELEALENCVTLVTKKVERAKLETKERIQECDESQTKLDQLRRKIDEKLREKELKESQQKELQKKIEEHKEVIDKNKKSVAEKIAEKRLELKYYEVLGLKIIRTNHNTILYSFTDIDSNEPERAFSLEVSLDEKKNYILHRSVPELENLKAMEVQLNKSGDLSGLICHVRCRFREMAR